MVGRSPEPREDEAFWALYFTSAVALLAQVTPRTSLLMSRLPFLPSPPSFLLSSQRSPLDDLILPKLHNYSLRDSL